jgi:hypothetical protein
MAKMYAHHFFLSADLDAAGTQTNATMATGGGCGDESPNSSRHTSPFREKLWRNNSQDSECSEGEAEHHRERVSIVAGPGRMHALY